jgi:hypothetical protein
MHLSALSQTQSQTHAHFKLLPLTIGREGNVFLKRTNELEAYGHKTVNAAKGFRLQNTEQVQQKVGVKMLSKLRMQHSGSTRWHTQ